MRASSASLSAALARPLQHLAGNQLVARRLALVGALLIAVDQHDLEPVKRAHIGDARAHEARAEHADLLRCVGGTPAGRRAPLFSSPLERNSERIIAAASLRAQNMREPARLDAQREIDRQLQAFDRRYARSPSPPDNCRTSRAGRWRSRRGQIIMPVGEKTRPDGALNSFGVPGRDRLAAVQIHARARSTISLCGAISWTRFVAFAAVGLHLLALEQHLQRVARRASGARRAACRRRRGTVRPSPPAGRLASCRLSETTR